MSRELPDLPAGVWRHYKGHYYLVLGYGRLSAGPQEGEPCVVYVGLELSDAKEGPRLQVRPVWGEDGWFTPAEAPATLIPEWLSNHVHMQPKTRMVGPSMYVNRLTCDRFWYVGPAWQPPSQ